MQKYTSNESLYLITPQFKATYMFKNGILLSTKIQTFMDKGFSDQRDYWDFEFSLKRGI